MTEENSEGTEDDGVVVKSVKFVVKYKLLVYVLYFRRGILQKEVEYKSWWVSVLGKYKMNNI